MKPTDEERDFGLICAYLFDGKGGARQLAWSEIDAAKSSPGVLWIHLNFTHPPAATWLLEKSGLDPTVADAMLESETRPRSFQFQKGILTTLRGVNANPNSSVEDMVTIRIWMEPKLIISTRRRHLLSIKDIRAALESGKGPVDAGEFLSQLAEHMVDRIGEVVNEIADTLDAMELKLQQEDQAPVRSQFSESRRRSARIRRYLAPQRDAFDRLSRMHGDILTEADCIEMNECANQMTFFVEELDLARERAMLAQEEILSLLAHNQNSKMFLLAIVSAVFLPLSFLTGLMGMNVAGLPGLENPIAFNLVVAIMAAIGVGIMLIFWKKKWF
jgi:zinc transporter